MTTLSETLRALENGVKYSDDDLAVIVQDWDESDTGSDQFVAIQLARECLRLRAILESDRKEVAPVSYIEGNQYMTQAGELVRFVKTHNAGNYYETMEDEAGVNRYTRRDFGRVTGSPLDYSDPRNTPPLYTSPAHTSEARDASQFYAACERACGELPEGWEIRVCLELGAGTVELCDPEGSVTHMDVDADDRLTAEVNAAVDAAMEASR